MLCVEDRLDDLGGSLFVTGVFHDDGNIAAVFIKYSAPFDGVVG